MKSLEHKTNLIFDLFFSIIVMPLLITLGPVQYWWGISPVFTILAIVYLYGCYFLSKSLELPALILSGAYYRIAGLAGLFILATWLLTLYPLPEMDFVIPSMSEYQTRVRNYNVTVTVWLLFLIVICYSLTAAFIKELYRRILWQAVVENQRDKAELALYKAQINPHFLFNTLNSLYSLIIGTSQKAEDAFIKFTELLKYTYMTANRDIVSIAEEIAYIDNYIDLQLIRLDSHTVVRREFSVDDEGAGIPPMILLTFVENAFKYGASSSRDCMILIRLSLQERKLCFETQNMIVKHSNEFRSSMPVGIENCRNRLTSLYAEDYQLDIEEKSGLFTVKLKINLDHHE